MSNGNGNTILGKTLKNVYNTTLRSFASISSNQISVTNLTASNLSLPFLSGNVFTGVYINNSFIDNTVIGNSGTASAIFTTLQSGTPGTGYTVSFYSNNAGDSLIWDPDNSTLNINGSLIVRDSATFGNLRIIGNNLQAVNTNGNVNLVPNGTGYITLSGPVQQTATGNSSYFSSGDVDFLSGQTLILRGKDETKLQTTYGDLYLETDNNIPIYSITSIVNSGLELLITTNSNHGYEIGDSITISGTNSTPTINGVYSIVQINSSNQFKITGNVSSSGNTGSVVRNAIHDIFINPGRSIKIPENKKFYLGDSYFEATNSILELVTDTDLEINLPISGKVILPDQTSLQIGNSIFSSQTGTLSLTTTQTQINSNLSVNGNVSSSGRVSFTGTPIVSLGFNTVVDNYDRGLEFFYNQGSAKTGFFGFKNSTSRFILYTDATNNNDVFSGTLGNLQLGTLYSQNIDLGGGNINNVNTINGQNTFSFNLIADPDLFLQATRYIYLQAQDSIRIADTIPLYFNNSQIRSNGLDLLISPNRNLILPNTSKLILDGTGNKFLQVNTYLSINSDTSLFLNLASGAVYMPENISLILGLSSQSITGSGNNLTLESAGDINLNVVGSVVLPAGKKIHWNTTDYILGNNGLILSSNGTGQFSVTSGLTMSSSTSSINLNAGQNINLTATTQINIPNAIPLYFGTNNIVSNVNNLAINSSGQVSTNSVSIELNASQKVNIPTNIPLEFGNISQNIVSSLTNLGINSSAQITLTAPTVAINGDLNVEGTVTYINSVITTLTDPVIQLGINTSNDGKDRGISFLWNTGTPKIGFLGWKNTTGALTFIPDATENSNIFTGTIGNLDIGQITATGLNLSGGSLTNLASIINTGSSLTISGNPNLLLQATNSVIFSASNSIQIPNNIPLQFSNSNFYISSDGSNLNLGANNLNFQVSAGDINFVSQEINLNATEDINIPQNIPLTFGNVSNYISGNGSGTSLVSGSLLNLIGTNINLDADTSVIIPQNVNLSIGGSTITGTTSQLAFVLGSKDLSFSLSAGQKVIIPQDVNLQFGTVSNNIFFDGNDLNINSSGQVIISPGLEVSGDLQITGNLLGATWQGSVIGISYGGTGKSSWTPGSVVFADTISLNEDNTSFFWHKTNKRLGLGTNSPFSLLTIKGDHQTFVPTNENDNQGILFRNVAGSYTGAIYRKWVSGFDTDLIMAVGNDANYTNLSPRLILSGLTGRIGIGFSSSSLINYPLHVNGDIGIEGNLFFTSNEYISEASGILTLNVSNSVQIPNTKSLLFGSNVSLVSNVGNDLTITTGGDVYIIPNTKLNLPVNKNLTFGSTDTEYIYADTNHDLFLYAQRYINLRPTVSVNLNTGIPLTFGSSSQSISSVSGNLSILSGSNISLTPTTQVQIPNDIPLALGTGTQLVSSVAGNFLLDADGDISLTPGTGDNIIIPDNNPLVFGAFGRRIVSDGTDLNIYGTDQIVVNVPNVQINGNLTVSNSLIYQQQQQIVTESTILILGNGNNVTITNIVNGGLNKVLVTVSQPHYLINGDSVTISQSDSVPVIDGTYNVTVISATVVYITFSVCIKNSGTFGIMNSLQVLNINKDIGIQCNWHDNTSGTAGAKYAFFGFQRTSERWMFITDGTNTADVFSGAFGDIQVNSIYSNSLQATSLSGTLNTNTQNVIGSNFSISGGTINNTIIGNTNPVSGTFSSLTSGSVSFSSGNINNTAIGSSTPSTGAFTTITVTSSALVNNLNSNFLQGKASTDFIWRDGSQSLNADWDAGIYRITSSNIAVSSLTAGKIVWTTTGGLLQTNSGFSFDNSTTTLSVTNISSFNSTGTITNTTLTGGTISGTDITIGTGKTLDITSGTLLLSNGQIDGSKLSGTANINITGNASTVSNGIYTTDYQANSILKADTANTPVNLNVGEETLVGRKTGSNINALTVSEVRTMLNIQVVDSTVISNAGGMLVSGSTMTGALNYSYQVLSLSGGGMGSPTLSQNMTYISVSGTGIATGTMPSGSIGGQWKVIFIDFLASGCSYQLTFPTGTLITPDGHTGAKTMSFTSAGQSIEIVYSPTQNRWMLRPGGITSFI